MERAGQPFRDAVMQSKHPYLLLQGENYRHQLLSTWGSVVSIARTMKSSQLYTAIVLRLETQESRQVGRALIERDNLVFLPVICYQDSDSKISQDAPLP